MRGVSLSAKMRDVGSDSSAEYAIFEEATRGSLVPGSFGDIVILDRAVDSISRPERTDDVNGTVN